jgi:hydrogenase expression/formation protein HypE
MRHHPKGHDAAIVGRVTKEHAGLVVARTALGANRVIPMQIGEQLPRIC